ncbi:MAG: alanine racemase [Anaerolineales bacterium]|jgi:alanine racemase
MNPPPELTWVEVDLAAIRNNVRELMRIAGRPLMAVVKANGYGHGAVAVAQAALQAGASWVGVARCSEGLELRRAGITAPILVLGATPSAEAEAAISSQLSLALYDRGLGEAYARQAAALGRRVSVHIKVDTGMGRLGILPQETASFGKWALEVPELFIEGVFTHFARADESDPGPTLAQIARFREALEALQASGVQPRWTHAANSAAMLRIPEARFDLCRAGIALYGLSPSREVPLPSSFRPALAWKACLASSKDLPAGWGVSYGGEYVTAGIETIGAIPVGYADGWRRSAPNQILMDGQRLEVIGRVCMDYCLVRLPAGGAIGDEVVLIGRQGDERILAEDVALRWGTINYEVVTGIAARVPRVYLGADSLGS